MKLSDTCKFHLISDICNSLASSDRFENLDSTLCKHLCELYNARSVIILSVQYNKNDKRTCAYKEVSSWDRRGSFNKNNKERRGFDSLESQINKESHLHTLEAGNTLSLPLKNVLVIPVLLGKSLCGLICLWTEAPLSTSKNEISLITDVVKKVFELWASRINKEHLIKSMTEFMPHPTLGLNEKGEIIIWNKAVENMTLVKAETVMGKGDHENGVPFYGERRMTVPDLILHPDADWEKRYVEFRRESDSVFSIAHCPCLPGGGAIITCKTSVLYELNGKIWGAIHTVRDITRELSIENTLHMTETMNKTITDIVNIGVAIFQDDTLIYHNERLRNLFGFNGKNISKNDFFNMIDQINIEDRGPSINNFNRMFSGRESMRFDFRMMRSNTEKSYRFYVQPDRIDNHDVLHVIADDITEEKILAQKAKLNEIKLYHEDRLTALGTMAAGVAHELNQPLNSILVTSDSLLYSIENGIPISENELSRCLELISNQVDRMSNVILNIRNFSREEKEILDESVSISEAVENVLSMIGRQLEVHGIIIHKNLTPHLLPIKASLNRMEQVIMNLINNARQALDECNKREKNIWISVYQDSDRIFFQVADNGTGVPENISNKIFDPFFTTKEVGKGTGLGLAITKSIILDLQGTINFKNNDMNGATFEVSFPAKEY